jgi:hypothetical protein
MPRNLPWRRQESSIVDLESESNLFDDVCPICLENNNFRNSIQLFPYGHFYHWEYIQRLLESQPEEGKRCAKCRYTPTIVLLSLYKTTYTPPRIYYIEEIDIDGYDWGKTTYRDRQLVNQAIADVDAEQ